MSYLCIYTHRSQLFRNMTPTMNRSTYTLASLALSRSFLSGRHSAAVLRPTHLLTSRFFSSSSRSQSPSSPWLRPSIGVAGGVIFAAGVASYYGEQVYAKELPRSPEYMPKEVVLYQYEACPFCNKVKAFLDYYDVPYQIVEVNPLSKKEIKWSDYKKVPILVVDGEQMNDSSVIIDKLGSMMNSDTPVKEVPENDEEKQWRCWVDNHLVHMLSPNIYRNTSEALESFDYITSNGNFGFTEKLTVKYAGAAAMYFVSKNLKKKYNITDERAALYEAAEQWVEALNGREFLGGSKPNLADLAVFGVLRPIRYLKSGVDMVENTQIGDWYARMESVVGRSSRIMIQE